jgi:hypothetical protein
MNVHTEAATADISVLDGTPLGDVLDDLEGFAWLPGFGSILAGVTEAAVAAATGRLTADHTQTALTVIANPANPDLTQLLAALARHLTSDANQALAGMPNDTRKTVAHLGEIHAFEAAELAPREHTNEAAGLIYESIANPTV